MTYEIRYADRVVDEHIPALSTSAKRLIQRAIEERLTHHPEHYGKPLRRSLAGHRRLRVSDYRVIYRIDAKARVVYVVTIGHRSDVYDE